MVAEGRYSHSCYAPGRKLVTMQKKETVISTYELEITTEPDLLDCIDLDELVQEIIYAINYNATEKYPEQAKKSGFIIRAGISSQPVPYEANLKAAYMDEFEGRMPTYRELRIIEDEVDNDFSRIDNEIHAAVEKLKEEGKLPHEPTG